MKIDDIFKKFSDAYSHSYEGERTVEDITEDLRHTLQFNDTPSFTDMQNGIVDCVGASVIASMVLTHFFKERAFCVVSLPGVPWLHESFWESKHTGVLEVLENEDVRIIDPTPINGYGYGTITKYFERKSLKKSGAGYKIVHTPDITDVEEWERYVYPYFQELSEQDVMDILAVDHCRSSLSEKPDYSTLKDLPKGTPGWAKDFLRLKAREFVRDGQIEMAENTFKKALEFTPNNVYLLREYGAFLLEHNQPQEAETIYSRAESTKDILVEQQQKIIAIWKKRFLEAKEEQDWKMMAYYGGAIFWREQSNSLLEKRAAEEIMSISYGGKLMPLYRFSSGWFKKENVSVGIVDASRSLDATIAQIDILAKNTYGQEFRDSYVYKLPRGSGFKCVIGDEDILKENGCVFMSKSPREAHRVLTGMVQPEMLIV